MTRIVGEVMTREVVRTRRNTPLKDVARLLDRHRISGLPVVDHDDKVLGVISGTDLVRRRSARSTGRPARRFRVPAPRRGARRTAAAVRAVTAGELMTWPAVTVHPEQRVADAARVMERHGVEHLPVVDEEDRLIGIATRRDLLRVFLRTDEEIVREIVDDVLTRAMCLPPGAVNVSVQDGMVTLEGCLERCSDIPSAIRLTYRIDGVVGVVNALVLHLDDDRAPTPPRTGGGVLEPADSL
ncbi:CBS domain-containing protein [Streptomyces sp. NPDC058751]|uniref:CBS domain-containing protein n=1 Tax=Streptomyces sp. NPDC058751 TaxID=3346623 RepID=UPI003676C288